ncbi:MAG: phosphoribosylanthranilate isomerase [Hadesarchaea archaeon]|nr:phosphoribosylanthranilate isomerase [Hadesarchaea archaeon]
MVKVKICGFTNPEDVKVACELGVDMVGAILVPKSSRYVTTMQARQILDAVSDGIAKVAVIMPKDSSEVEKMARELKPDYLQIHLTFPAGKLFDLKERLDTELIIVTPIPREIENRKKIIDRAIGVAEVADYVLLDTKGPSGGGTGLTHDWSLSGEIREAVKKPIFLAGGLNASNVGQAIKIVRPYGVDVATGVESSPGKKDARLMREFIGAVGEA